MSTAGENRGGGAKAGKTRNEHGDYVRFWLFCKQSETVFANQPNNAPGKIGITYRKFNKYITLKAKYIIYIYKYAPNLNDYKLKTTLASVIINILDQLTSFI